VPRAPGEVFTFDVRLVVHDGDVAACDLATLYGRYLDEADT